MKREERKIEVGSGKVATVKYPADSEKWFFVCHGFGGHKERQEYIIKAANEAGFNAVGLDFRGNGDSSGEFIEQNLSSRIEDLKAVLEEYNPEKFVLFGTSFGGKVVLHTAEELNPEALILKSPLTFNETMESIRAAVEEKGEFSFIDGKPIDMSFFQDLDTYSFEDIAGDIDAPVLLFHGAADTTVHVEETLDAAKLLDTDVTFEKFKGVKHSFTEEAKEDMKDSISDWLERQL